MFDDYPEDLTFEEEDLYMESETHDPVYPHPETSRADEILKKLKETK